MGEVRRATLDLSGCNTLWDLHTRIKEALDFPDYYGKNWGAFWDCLHIDCEYSFITVTGETKVANALKESVAIMNKILERTKQYWNGEFDYEIID